jgi:hypothetical protein
MPTFDLSQLLAVLSVVLAATVLSASGAAIVLAFSLGLVAGAHLRKPSE